MAKLHKYRRSSLVVSSDWPVVDSQEEITGWQDEINYSLVPV